MEHMAKEIHVGGLDEDDEGGDKMTEVATLIGRIRTVEESIAEILMLVKVIASNQHWFRRTTSRCNEAGIRMGDLVYESGKPTPYIDGIHKWKWRDGESPPQDPLIGLVERLHSPTKGPSEPADQAEYVEVTWVLNPWKIEAAFK
jgi:hypothetical protein